MKILPIFIPHLGCPFECIYCNQKTITKSQAADFMQLEEQLSRFCQFNQNTEKEIAFFGGTFTNLPAKIQQQYFDLIKPYPNCSIRLSTRPDAVDKEKLTFCQKNKVRVIELGIQSFSDDVLSVCRRGYNSAAAINACHLVHDFGFQLVLQLMPGLPGFSERSWQKTLQTTLNISPDFVRIYPTIILKGTELEQQYSAGKYKPLDLYSSIKITAEAVEIFEQKKIGIIKLGLHSDIDLSEIAAGPFHQSFGELVRAEILMNKITKSFKLKSLVISEKDISLFKGFDCAMLKKLKTVLKIEKLPLIIDPKMEKGKFLFTDKSPEDYW